LFSTPYSPLQYGYNPSFLTQTSSHPSKSPKKKNRGAGCRTKLGSDSARRSRKAQSKAHRHDLFGFCFYGAGATRRTQYVAVCSWPPKMVLFVLVLAHDAPSWWATCTSTCPPSFGSLIGTDETPCANWLVGGNRTDFEGEHCHFVGWTKALDFAALVEFRCRDHLGFSKCERQSGGEMIKTLASATAKLQ